jgi:2'-5' RNA ligase
VSGAERVRLFVALELPEEVRSELVRWRRELVTPALAPVSAESLHVTLCFLGSLPFAQAPAIGDAHAKALADAGPIQLRIGGAIWLPRRRPHVLAVALDDSSGELERHWTTLGGALAAGGWYRPESRPLLPHVTVARVRRGARVRAAELDGPAPLSFTASRVTLFRSHLGAGGARYEPLRGIELLARDRQL